VEPPLRHQGVNWLLSLAAYVKREFILWMHETTFWGMEVKHILKGKKIPSGPTRRLDSRLGEKVRSHVIGLGERPLIPLSICRGTAGWSAAPRASAPPVSAPSAASFVVEAGQGVGPGEWHY
jgi:hypothetical protein